MKSPRTCCAQTGDLQALDRAYVMVEGIYTPVGTFAGIKTDAGVVVMLELESVRPAEEMERFGGRHVVVYGRLHSARPHVAEIERIEVR
jgi:hypothetical protein